MISPRKEELAAVVAILEGDEHEDSQSMAKALIKKVSELFEDRDAYGVGIGLPGDNVVLSHGPYWGLLDAKRTVKEAEARGLRAFIAPLFGPARALGEELESKHETCKCGHPKALHGISMTTFTGKPKPMASLGCAVYRRGDRQKCDCPGYEKG